MHEVRPALRRERYLVAVALVAILGYTKTCASDIFRFAKTHVPGSWYYDYEIARVQREETHKRPETKRKTHTNS